ncbi:unnamed protein product [Prorocentrum cordatum]|uniref:inorganic diphosphatase n=1 Tax=Prorocentrum cordatum TaxID=2364126 RepID=A0ABN9U0Z7_9DINO|nr:unnamed protein product [Polarella glacialis]
MVSPPLRSRAPRELASAPSAGGFCGPPAAGAMQLARVRAGGAPRARRGAALLASCAAAALAAHRCLAFGLLAGRSSGVKRGAVAVGRRAVQTVEEVRTEVRGKEGSAEFRRFFLGADGKEVSPWHDLPLEVSGVKGDFWMVTEIPKMTKPKMEIATKEPWNPIAQDVKNGALRDYHGPIFWNYGFLPQTWEDPSHMHNELKVNGDDDPVDVVEIGSRAHKQGEIVRVKVLGVLAMIDSGELDWKVIAISADDELADQLNDIKDVETKMVGVVAGIREWFRWYKTPDGKPLNSFGYGEEVLGKKRALEVIQETHDSWARLRESGGSKLWTGK